MARTNASLKKDPQFQALVATLGSEEKAKAAFNRLRPAAEVDPRIKQLLDAGFTKAEAEAALVETEAVEAKAPETNKDRATALVESKGYEFTKGRVYGGPSLAEAMVRVHRNGKPEIVQSSGVGRTKAVLVYKEESGDVALQNLTKD